MFSNLGELVFHWNNLMAEDENMDPTLIDRDFVGEDIASVESVVVDASVVDERVEEQMQPH